eukprot:scaffold98469_cov63-Cyclotella_meneghiniana.AAC.7
MIGGRNYTTNNNRGGRGGRSRRGRGGGRFTTPNNHQNNNNNVFGQSPFPPFQGGMPFGGMQFGTPGHYGPYFGFPFQTGGGYNPGFDGANAAVDSNATETAARNDGFVSPARKGTIKPALRGTPTPPPKKTRWNNNFEILREEEKNEGESLEETAMNAIKQGGLARDKTGNATKEVASKTKKGMEKIDSEVDALATEIEGGRWKKKKEVNIYNQSTNRLAKPTTQQSKVYLQLRDKISSGSTIRMADLKDIPNEVHQTSVLVAMVTQKHAEYAALHGNGTFETDKAYDRAKYMRKSALLKALNHPVTHENLHEAFKGHSYTTLNSSTISQFPHLLGSQLMETIQQPDPAPAYIRKASETLLKRVYMNDQDRVDDFLSSLSDEEVVELATNKGELIKSFSSTYNVSLSLPYRIDLDEFPKPAISGWSGKPHPHTSDLKDAEGDVEMQTPQKESDPDSPQPMAVSIQKLTTGQRSTTSSEVTTAPAPDPSKVQDGVIDTSTTPGATSAPPEVDKQPNTYGKGSNKSSTIASFRMRLQVKRFSAQWSTGIAANASFTATTFLNYYLGLAKDYDHLLEIMPFNECDLPNLTVEDSVSMLPLETLHKYVGTLVKINETNWRSFEFKIKTSIPSPHNLPLTPLLSNGGQNPLANYLEENHLIVLLGTRWTQPKHPLYLLAESDIADDPEAISHEIHQRIRQATEDVAPQEMDVEWCHVDSTKFGRDQVTAPGYYIMGSLQSEDKIEYLLGKLKRDTSWPLTGCTQFLKARSCSKNNDNTNEIHETLKAQQKYARNRVYFSIVGIPPETLNIVPSDSLGLNSSNPNNKSVRELLLNLQADNTQSTKVIEKIGVGDSTNQLIFMGNAANTEALKPIASFALEKLHYWSSTNSGKLDLTTLTPPPIEPTFQPGMLIHTPQADTTPPKRPRLSPPRSNLHTPTTAQSSQIDKLIVAVNTLQNETKLMKEEMSKRPTNIAVPSVITDALSSLSDKVEHVAADAKSKHMDIATLKANSEEILMELARVKNSNDMDQAIIRAHLSGDYLIDFPTECSEDQIYLPPHGHSDELPNGHSHPKEVEERLNNLSPQQIIQIVQNAPSFVDHTNDNFCLVCLEDSSKGDLSCECSICKGVFHETCQNILEYKHETGDLLACYRCRIIQQYEKGVSMMLECKACLAWVEAKKKELVALSNSEKHRLRMQKLAIVCEGMISLNVLKVVDQTEDALAQIYQERNNPDLDFDPPHDDFSPDQATTQGTPAVPTNVMDPISTAISKKGSTDGSAEDQHLSNVAIYRSEVSRLYPSHNPGEEIFEHLVHNWMDERSTVIDQALTQYLNSEKKTLRIEYPSTGPYPEPPPEELHAINKLRDCHSLFWPTESNKLANGICPFAEANSQWWENSGMSTIANTHHCTDGYDLNVVDMITHLQSHHHWIAQVAAIVVMEHDVTTCMHELRAPNSNIKETASPHQPQNLFKPTPTTNSDSNDESESDEEIQQAKTLLSNRRRSQMLAGIMESSSEDKESNDSDSETASESKRFKTAQDARYQSSNAKEKRSSMRLRERKKKDVLTSVDDGESSIDSVLSKS